MTFYLISLQHLDILGLTLLRLLQFQFLLDYVLLLFIRAHIFKLYLLCRLSLFTFNFTCWSSTSSCSLCSSFGDSILLHLLLHFFIFFQSFLNKFLVLIFFFFFNFLFFCFFLDSFLLSTLFPGFLSGILFLFLYLLCNLFLRGLLLIYLILL